MDLQDVLRDHRTRLGLSQAELADKAGLSLRQINRYESGTQQPTLSAAIRMSEALGISLNELAGLDSDGLDLNGSWFMCWQRFESDGYSRLDTHELRVTHRADRVLLDAERGKHSAAFAVHADLKLWPNGTLTGWYASADPDIDSGGTIGLSRTGDADFIPGRWYGVTPESSHILTGIIVISRSLIKAQEKADELAERDELEILARRYGPPAGPE